MSLPVRLDHSVVHVSDWATCNAFYRDILGATVTPTPSGAVAYRFSNAQLNLHGPGAVGEPRARIPVEPGNSDLCFEWDGAIDDAIAHLQSHSVEIELGPVRRFGCKGEGTSVYFRDPDGTLLEFISYR